MRFVARMLVLAGIVLMQVFILVQTAGSQTGIAGPVVAQEEKKPRISAFKLANGLQVVVIPDRRAPIVTHMIWYKVGAADEDAGKSGVAHYLEHLMFKGTKNAPAGEFSTKVAEIGGRENAFTAHDYTAYYQKVSPDALKMVMSYEADRMENLALSNEAIEPERDVVLEERRMRVDNKPEGILFEALQSALFSHHPYGIPVIGYEIEIRGLTLEDVIGFYNKHYAPNNAILVVAGDVDERIVRKLAEETYGKAQRQAEPDSRRRVKEPEPVVARTLSYRDKRVTSPSLSRLYLAPSYSSAEPGEAEALDILAEILGGSSASRLYRGLVVNQEIATGAGAGFRGGMMDMGWFSIWASPRGKTTIRQLEAAIDGILQDIVDNGVKQKELDHARNAMIKSVIYARDNQTAMANIIGASLSTGRKLEDVLNWTDNLKRITVEDINAAAKKILKKSRSATGYLLPDKSGEKAKKP